MDCAYERNKSDCSYVLAQSCFKFEPRYTRVRVSYTFKHVLIKEHECPEVRGTLSFLLMSLLLDRGVDFTLLLNRKVFQVFRRVIPTVVVL